MSQLRIRVLNKTAELWLYGDIGGGLWGDGITAMAVADELKKHPQVTDITVRINSSGGDVFEGVAIYNQLRRHKGRISVDVDGAALSIASVISMAADPGELRMADNAFMMIHDPWSVTFGDEKDHRKTADLLSGIKNQIVNTYMSRTQRDAGEIAQMMADETWMDAKTAESLGFIDARTNELAIAAHINDRICRRMPDYVHHWQQIAAKELRDKTEDLKKQLDSLRRG